MTTPQPWLSLQHLNFRRSERTILDDLSLEFRDAELVLLTGQNGSGKTTLLRILAGLLKPQQLRLVLEGRELSWRRSRPLLRREIWNFALERHVLDRPLERYRLLELSRRVVLFFDRALYHAARGYEELEPPD